MTIWVQLLVVRTPKIWEVKKRLKIGAISDSFGFDREYLRNGLRYQKPKKAIDQLRPLARLAKKKLGELWSLTKRL